MSARKPAYWIGIARKIIHKIGSILGKFVGRFLLVLIFIYQKTISPLKGQTCRFYPTCSEYTKQAIIKYGPVKGTYLGMRRILKCHPFHPGGYDPLI